MKDKKFNGFTIPEGAWIPPELIYMLPALNLSKLKVLITVIYSALQIGGNETISLTDIQYLTGLSRSSVNKAIRDLLGDGIIERQPVGKSFSYSIVQNLHHLVKLSKEKGSNKNLLSNLNCLNLKLISTLREQGVYLKTAQKIVSENEEDFILEKLEHYRYALDRGLAQGPGWLVLSLKESWGPPLGYKPAEGTDRDRAKYEDWNKD